MWCVIVYHVETSLMRRPWPPWGLSRHKQTNYITKLYSLLRISSSQRRDSPKYVSGGADRKLWVISRSNDVDMCTVDTADEVW